MAIDNEHLDTIFNIVNIIPLPVWLLMSIAPQWNVTHTIVKSHITSIVISIIFVALNIIHFSNDTDEFEITGFFSLNVIAYVFSKRFIVLIGWVHYLAFDVFIGSWIFLDNLKNKTPLPHFFMILCFLFTYTFGPSGFLLYVTLKKLMNVINSKLEVKNKND
ncbi:unnamed protein product [Cunninghamella blakesleeana]